jgi:hypothetical protein
MTIGSPPVKMPIDLVLSRLDAVRLNGGGWTARCPARGHGRRRGDRNPSLSVDVGGDGRVLLNCHAGCSIDSVVNALGLKTADLFSGRRTRTLRETVFDVRNAEGIVVARHIRRDKPDGSKSYLWRTSDDRLGLSGIPVSDLPLFGIELVSRLANSVMPIVTEGEKAAAALVGIGWPAVGTVTGASGTPSVESLRPLARFTGVLLWPDNDDQGRQHMSRIAGILRDLGVEARWIHWKQAELKGDAADFVDRGGRDAALVALIEAAGRSENSELREPAVDEHVGVLMSDVRAEVVNWLWQDRVPLGKVTILDGDPGLGKSTLMLDIAARVTRGLPMPNGAAQSAGGVVILTAEDGLGDTVRPRLEASGADLSRIKAIPVVRGTDGAERQPELPTDLNSIERAIADVDARLVIVDPLMAYLSGRTDSHRDQDVRRAMAPLAAMAERTGVAVVVIRHLNKTAGGHPIYRGGGSIGIIGAARSALLVAKDPEDDQLRVIASVKSNLGPAPDSLRYRMAGTATTVTIEWLGSSPFTATALLAAPPMGDQRTALDEAKNFLRELLKNGQLPVKRVQAQAREAGISEMTLRRARQAIGITVAKEGFTSGKWVWRLEDDHLLPKVINVHEDPLHPPDDHLQSTERAVIPCPECGGKPYTVGPDGYPWRSCHNCGHTWNPTAN